jgi:sporulation protein YtfJ
MNENNHPINDLMETTMAKIREMVDTNTVVGQPIVTDDGVTLIPVSKLTFGFASGGSDFAGKNQQASKNFGGGAGAGVSVMPVAFLVVKDGNVKLIPVAPPAADTAGRVVEMVPEMFDKVTGYIDKKTENKSEF